MIFVGCQTRPKLSYGVQEGFESLAPGSVIAVPPLVYPQKRSDSIDPALLAVHPITVQVEKQVVMAFQGQPHIKGYAFADVEKVLKKTSPHLLDRMQKTYEAVMDRLASSRIQDRLLLSPECLSRNNFLEFYSYCLAPEPQWIQELNELSVQVRNADAALLVFVPSVNSSYKNKSYGIEMSLAVLLVDTNNGKLMWGNEAHPTRTNPPQTRQYPAWEELALFSPEFWKGFPGFYVKGEVHEQSKQY